MTIGEADARFVVHHGDNMAILPTLADCSVDAIVTDPPAGIAFMGQTWDRDKGGRDAWIAWLSEVMSECLRVLKPGGHALVWAIPRTSHWTGMAIENAGFEVRDRIAHCFGSGFPKSLSVSKAIDKAVGAEGGRGEIKSDRHAAMIRTGRVGAGKHDGWARDAHTDPDRIDATARAYFPATDAARQWQGWGTALKPAIEDWWLARKPLVGNVAQNVLAHGTGAINIDACRIGTDGGGTQCGNRDATGKCLGHKNAGRSTTGETFHGPETEGGRWPANLIHSGEPEVLAAFPDSLGMSSGGDGRRDGSMFGGVGGISKPEHLRGDTGSAARFFMQCPPDEATSLYYTPKASRADRDKGNTHSTVKPIALMRYLCRLITPPDGVVFDPFAGSGSTGQAAMFEGFRFIGIEADAEHVEIARHRVGLAARNGWQPGLDLGRSA